MGARGSGIVRWVAQRAVATPTAVWSAGRPNRRLGAVPTAVWSAGWPNRRLGALPIAVWSAGWPTGARAQTSLDPAHQRRRGMTTTRNPAVRAEPRGIGTANARDPLAREVKLLGSLLGQVIVEQAGLELLETVERIRRRTIALRRDPDEPTHDRLTAELAADLDALDPDRAELVIRAFALYFRLVDLAESRNRVRTLRRRERASGLGILDDSVGDAVRRLWRSGLDSSQILALLGRLRIGLVLTAHPTEARRRTLLIALQRLGRLLERLDDPRLTRDEDADLRRHLREEITLLWRTGELRSVAPNPLDEVRTEMVAFDETLFTITPRLYRAIDAAVDRLLAAEARERRAGSAEAADGPVTASTDTGRTGTRPPAVGAFISWGSWVGADRDGNPNVTAEITAQTLRIQADHLLHGYEAVANRLMQTVAAEVAPGRLAPALEARLARDTDELPETMRVLRRRFPDEPYRIRLGAIAERVRRTRAGLAGGMAPLSGRYAAAADLSTELTELSSALAADGLERVAWGELGSFGSQVETFGFHLAALDIRQHSAVHEAALRVLRRRDRTAADLEAELPGSAGRLRPRGPRDLPPDGGRPAPIRRGSLQARHRLVHPRSGRRPRGPRAGPSGWRCRAWPRLDRRLRACRPGGRRCPAARVARCPRPGRADPR